MPNPLDFLLNPIRRDVGGVWRGIDALGGQINPTRRQPMPQVADVNPAELAQVREYLTPGINGQPNPASRPRAVMPSTNGAGNLAQAAGIPNETRAGNYASALGVPDTGGGVLMPASRRPAMPSNIPGGDPDQYAPQLPAITPPQKTYQHQRLDYRDQHGKRSLREIATSGLYGMAATGGQGGVGGLLGGFIGGALGHTIAPKASASNRFAMGPGRRVLADQQMQRDDELYGLKVRGQEAQIEKNRQQAEAAKRRDVFHNVPRNNSVIDPTGKQVYQAPQTPVAPFAISPVTLDINGVPTVVDGRTGKPLGKAYIKPGDDTGLMNVPAGGAVFSKKDGRVLYQNPGKEAQVTPAETRQRTENASREVQAHNKLRQMVIEKGNQIAALKGQGDPEEKIPVLSAEYNALKQQFDAESERIRTTYADDLEDVGQGGWSFFKAKPRPAGQSARPVMPSGNGSAKRSSVPRAWVREYAQENGISEQQAEAIFARKYNIHD